MSALVSRGQTFGEFASAEAIATQPTKEMRAELETAGVALPDDDALTELSTKFNIWLEELRVREGKDASHSFFNLFNEVDEGARHA